jgi:hypothetical protein
MIVSPTVVFLAMVGAGGLRTEGLGFEGVLLGAAVGLGILWSNATLYHDTPLADDHRFAELREIGKHQRDKGPILVPEFEDYALWYLRDSRPYGPTFSYSKLGKLRDGKRPIYGDTYDLDQLPLWYVERANEVLLRRSPVASRPPADYSLVQTGRYYELWRRDRGNVRVIRHVPVSAKGDAGRRVPCKEVRAIAQDAKRAAGELAFVVREQGMTIYPARARASANWAGQLGPRIGLTGPGELDARLRSESAGEYRVWVNGSLQRGVSVYLDGRKIGAVHNELNTGNAYASVGRVALAVGEHLVKVTREGGNLRPGNGYPDSLGPIELARDTSLVRKVEVMRPANYRTACGRRLDWIEIVSR